MGRSTGAPVAHSIGAPVDNLGQSGWVGAQPGCGGGGGTQSRKGYRLWPNCLGAMAVGSQHC